MKNKSHITIFSILIVIFSIIATSQGIFSSGGKGKYQYTSIRGQDVTIYGKGIYEQMSSDVAIQGIAQDYITLFVCVPLLMVSLFFANKGSMRARFVLAGVLNYFLVTYLFYLTMAMYNSMFLIYVVLLSTSFFAFILTIISWDIKELPEYFKQNVPTKYVGIFLIIMSSMIAILWLGIVVPPLLNGTIIPIETAHYTTLIVQGFDLSLMLPIAFLSGFLFLKRNNYGYFMAPVTIIFLPLLMLALVAKIIAMAMNGVNVIPVIFIIPAILLLALIGAAETILSIKQVK